MSLDLISAPDPEPEPEPEDPPLTVRVTLFCRTEGCENEGVPITLEVPLDTNYAFCGPCGGRITEYTEETQ